MLSNRTQSRIDMRDPKRWLKSLLAVVALAVGIETALAKEAALRPAIPSLDEMAGEWVPMKDVASPPAIHNLHDILLGRFDLVSFSYNPGYSILLNLNQERRMYPTVSLFIGDKEWPGAECRWFPYKILRRNLDCGGVAVETDLRMISEAGAASVSACRPSSRSAIVWP